MTFADEIKHLRAALAPGDRDTVGLYWQSGDQYFNAEFIASAIATFEARALCAYSLGDKLNPLEQLGALLLRSAAGLPQLP